MSTQITNYQCPNCLGGLRFDGGLGQQVCDNCGARFDIAVIEQIFADKEQQAAAVGVEPKWDITLTNNFTAEEAARLRGYACPSCAAEIICCDTTVATSCPYCGNPTVVPGQFADELRPDYIVPFVLDRNAAKEALLRYYKGKKFLPKYFSEANHIEEITGVYVPFWLFSGKAKASMRFSAKKVTSFKSGQYRTTHTDYYRLVRQGTVAFEKVPTDASSKMPDAHMDSIEPFEYDGLKPFSSAYLPGFLANKYDEDAEFCSKRANERITASTESAFLRTTLEYSSVRREYSSIELQTSNVKYAMMPVWMLATRWHDKSFLFAMNAQTGKLVGDLPVDAGKYWGWFFGIAGPIAALLIAILFGGGGIF